MPSGEEDWVIVDSAWWGRWFDRCAVRDPELPQVRAVGAFLPAPGGYPSDRSWAPPGSFQEVRSVFDTQAAVGEQHRSGARAVKVVLHPGAGPTGLAPDDVLTATTDLDSPAPPCWVPSGLDRRPSRFAGSLCTARVLDPFPTS
ncbi:hypothetical protein ACH347_08665 [Saccharopolyspora sp. 5N102]|uniref:hypothetical protein n=1 Tax=Saccharopolyspora sp. 5N102 TaxID=3375155 RepID=UPI0037984EC3